jgi:uncharacterized protein (TIGR03663 family)
VAVSLLLHLWQLDERSFHHDESIHAKLSWDLAQGRGYRYDPTYHGPLLYVVVAATYGIAGDSDLTARLPIALCGVALLALAWRLRRPFGERAAWWAGLLATLSPTLLFYGRFLRMDILELATASAAMLAFWAVLRGSSSAWGWVGLWAGLAFATKENAYVTAAVVVFAAACVGLVRGPVRSVVASLRWLHRQWAGVVLAGSVFVLVSVPLYTVGLAHPEDWLFPVRAVSYWWQQHTIERVPGPWWFYLPRLLQYEFLILGAAVVWVVRRLRRLRSLEIFLTAFALGSVAMYLYLGEKVPWLVVHQVWLFIPLAGAQLARTFGPRGRWWSRTLAAAAVAATAVASVTANFVLDEISPAAERVESLHFVQTTPELVAAAREARVRNEEGYAPPAMATGEAVWPLSWYWRRLPVSWSLPEAGDEPGMVICNPEEEAEALAALGEGWWSERLPLRSWWLMYVGEPTPGDWARYMLTRRHWGAIGSTEVVVIRRGRDPRDIEDEDLLYWWGDE